MNHRKPGSPINVREAPKRAPRRAPEIGQDSVAVLRELDFEDGYIKQLLDAQVIFAAADTEQGN